MKKFEYNKFDAFVSDEAIAEYNFKENEDAEYIQDSLSRFIKEINLGENALEYLEVYAKANNLEEKYAFLYAHGSSNGKWSYRDKDKFHSVQKWINENDGKYSGLIFKCCNPASHIPHSKKSALFVPDQDVFGKSLGMEFGRDTCFEIFAPGKIRIDSYTMDYDLNKLRDKTKQIRLKES